MYHKHYSAYSKTIITVEHRLDFELWGWDNSRVSCQKGPTCHAYAWQIGPFWQDTLDMGCLFSIHWKPVTTTYGDDSVMRLGCASHTPPHYIGPSTSGPIYIQIQIGSSLCPQMAGDYVIDRERDMFLFTFFLVSNNFMTLLWDRMASSDRAVTSHRTLKQ